MEEIINEGHAAILVSHGMSNVRRMSQVCLWLREGRVKMFGPTHEVVSHYEKQTTQEVVSHYEKRTPHQLQADEGDRVARLSRWSVGSSTSTGVHTIGAGQGKVTLSFELELASEVANAQIALSVTDAEGLVLITEEAEFLRLTMGCCLRPHLPSLPRETR